MMDKNIKKQNEQAQRYSESLLKVREEISKVIVGQEDVVRKLVIALIANGHILLEGVPGLAKTLMIKTLSDTMTARFHRVQFTPDLLPADIVGTKIFNMKTSSFVTKKGPIFTNFLLADEINRAPPKCQSALLEAMQERQVTIGEETYPMPDPFLVLATMNPIENEGVYALPEAQVDRFMLKVKVNYPTRDQERLMLERMTEGKKIIPDKVIGPQEIQEMQDFCRTIYCDDKIKHYVTDIVHATRDPKVIGLEKAVEYGASPRASIWLVLGAKANALLNGRGYVIPEDVQEVCFDVLRHRIILSYEAEAEGMSTDEIVKKVLDKIKVP